ncbi:MAG TPA: hypothetical protein VFQ12_12135 [Thermoleophilaceae bacterium]|nr:hypothetical protein [Thermoleophilaceae bacterium]
MRVDTPRIRLAAVTAAATLVLHELRYLIGFGDHANETLVANGHAYLPVAGAVAGGLFALAGAQLLTAIERARRTARGESTPGFARLWVAMSVVILVVYSGQELIEAALSPGAGPGALLAGGGWSALPLAVAIGAAAALLLRGAGRAVAFAAARRRPMRFGVTRRAPRRRAAPVRVPASPLARHLASRAPPVLRPST